MDKSKINFDDDVIKVYKGRKIVFFGQFDQYFIYGDDFEELFEYDCNKQVYIGKDRAEGFKVRKVN